MQKKLLNFSLLLLFIVPATLFTSCKKEKDAPSPKNCSCPKDAVEDEFQDDKPKEDPKKDNSEAIAKVEKLLKTNRWKMTKGGQMMAQNMSGLHFKSGTVDVFYGNNAKPFDDTTIETEDFEISDEDPNKIRITEKRYTILELTETTLVLKSRIAEYTFENVAL